MSKMFYFEVYPIIIVDIFGIMIHSYKNREDLACFVYISVIKGAHCTLK